MTQSFLLGVNYWPRRKAMYWWSDFEADEVREEFALIADLGLKIVRIFLLWDDFQPTPDTVAEDKLTHLETVCDIAVENGLQLDVTFFTGHMSGPNWAPQWLLDADAEPPSPMLNQLVSGGKIVEGAYRNMFEDEEALNASRLLLTTVVTRFKDHPAIWMWNLGNEPDLFAWPHSAESGKRWANEMVSLIKSIDSNHPVTCGLHSESLSKDNGLRIHDVFDVTDVATMHTYPMYTEFVRHELDPDYVPFTCALVTAMCGMPTLMEEWGGCTAPQGEPTQIWEWTAYGKPRTQFMASEDDFAKYVEAVLPKLVEVGATGAFLWCFADYIEDLWDRPPCEETGAKHERHFGLVRPDGSLKPHAEVMRKFAQTNPTVKPPVRVVNLDISADEYYENPYQHLKRLYMGYLDRYEND